MCGCVKNSASFADNERGVLAAFTPLLNKLNRPEISSGLFSPIYNQDRDLILALTHCIFGNNASPHSMALQYQHILFHTQHLSTFEMYFWILIHPGLCKLGTCAQEKFSSYSPSKILALASLIAPSVQNIRP